MSEQQRRWVEETRRERRRVAEEGDKGALSTFPPPVAEDWRLYMYNMVVNVWFERMVIFTILANAVTMCLRYKGQPDSMTQAVYMLNLIFTVVYLVEAVMKITAFGWWPYIADKWNLFDFIVLLFGIIGLFFTGNSVSAATAFRVLRFMRLFKVITHLKGLRQLITTIALSIPALANVGAFLTLLIYIWSVVGMALFGDPDSAGFRHIGASCYTMLRVLTGDGWDQILMEIADGETGTAFFAVALAFLVSFVVLCNYIVMSIFVAIVLVNFTDEVLGNPAAGYAII